MKNIYHFLQHDFAAKLESARSTLDTFKASAEAGTIRSYAIRKALVFAEMVEAIGPDDLEKDAHCLAELIREAIITYLK